MILRSDPYPPRFAVPVSAAVSAVSGFFLVFSISVFVINFFAAVPALRHMLQCNLPSMDGPRLVSRPLDDTNFPLFAFVILVPLCCEWFYSHRQWLGHASLGDMSLCLERRGSGSGETSREIQRNSRRQIQQTRCEGAALLLLRRCRFGCVAAEMGVIGTALARGAGG